VNDDTENRFSELGALSATPSSGALAARPGFGAGAAGQGGRLAVLALAIKERAALYAAYMPYLRNGGIFVPTQRSYALGDEVYLILTLLDNPARIPVGGRVVWVSPASASASRTPGVGVHFPDDESGIMARRRIEEALGSAMRSTRPTHTI
jgi:type IV pilus assembly protein PilZ